MQLRARLALVALVLMLVPTVALSIISLDSRISAMVDNMSRSTDFMIAQIFEQVRLALSQSDSDVATTLRSSEPVRQLLDSTVAFGPAVVAASIVGNDGIVIVAAHGEHFEPVDAHRSRRQFYGAPLTSQTIGPLAVDFDRADRRRDLRDVAAKPTDRRLDRLVGHVLRRNLMPYHTFRIFGRRRLA